ncbi:MAG: AEC family transporter [Clostridia bacterium]|nr:AEC family transporter [Clostridia bacterium]
MKELSIVSNQLFLFSFLYVVGILSAKLKIIRSSDLDSLAKFIVNVTMPLMLFTTITNGPKIDALKDITPIFLWYPIVIGLLFLVSGLVIKIFKIKDEHKNLFRATFVFGNTGFIGIPLILSLFPQSGIIYISGCMIIDQLLLWTVGIWLTKPVKPGESQGFFQEFKNIINPSVVSIFLAVICLMLGFRLPNLLNQAFSQVGNLTTALALIYVGGLFFFTDKKSMFKNIDAYLIVIFKMLIIPILLFLICKQAGAFTDQIKVILVLLALPSMSSLVIFAKINHSDSRYTLANITLSTILSLLTIPVLIFLFN